MLFRSDPVTGNWTGETTFELGPAIIAVYGATSVDEDLELFVDRHGKAALAPAVTATIEYLQGNTTRRGVADDLGVPAVEAIAVTQAIERIIAVVKAHDPTLDDIRFEVDVHDRSFGENSYRGRAQSETATGATHSLARWYGACSIARSWTSTSNVTLSSVGS